ncbi:MAG: MBL fold metallo-hydrolase [Bdellovibrionales bacterium]
MSDHFDGVRFRNPGGAKATRSYLQLLRWQLLSRKISWPRQVPNLATPVVAAQVPEGEAHITFINHATLLIQLNGANILTDPVFSERVSPFKSVGPKRVRPPGIPLSQLPNIHFILVSHNHYDHLDVEALRSLAANHQSRVITPLGNAELIRAQGFKEVIELDWWQDKSFDEIKITTVPAQHWSGRGFKDRNRALWGGFFVRLGEMKVFFAGDTGYGAFFKDIHLRLGSPSVAILPIGAYEPRWFMKEQHMNPAEAVQAHLDVGAQMSIGMHLVVSA